MIYFDTDVLVNYCIEQETTKHQQAIQLVEQAITDGLFCVSAHSLNELAYVLAKLKLSREIIEERLMDFYLVNPVSVTATHIQRSAQIAYKVSFHHMSDSCIQP